MFDVNPLVIHCRCGAWRWEPCKTRNGTAAKEPCKARVVNASILARLKMLPPVDKPSQK